MGTTRLAVLVASLALPSLANAQRAAPPAWSATAGLAATPDGGVLAEGPAWQARFGAGALVLRTPPTDAADAPPSARVALSAVRRGDAAWLVAHGDARPIVERERVVYAHERGLLERYDVRAEGVELSLVFPTRPAGAGDLVVELAIDSELALRCAPDGRSARLIGPAGGMRIGAVRGVDARGRTVDGTLRARPGSLELVLPDAFVRDAALPLVLDPLLGPDFEVSPGNWLDVGQASSYAGIGRDVWLVVWRRVFGGTDTDLRAQRFEADGTPLGGLLLLTNDIDRQQLDAAVDDASGGLWLVAWSERPGTGGDADVLCRTVDARDGNLSSVTPVEQTAADETEPAVGTLLTNLSNGQRGFLVATVRDGVRVRVRVMVAGALIPPYVSSGAFAVHDTAVHGGDRVGAPSVAREQSNTWALVYEVHFPSPSPGDMDVFGALVDYPTMAMTRFPVSGRVGLDEARPAIAGERSSSYLVVWQQDEGSSGPTSRDVRGLPIDMTSGAPIPGAPFDISAAAGRDEAAPTVATGGDKTYVAWAEVASPNATEVHTVGLCGAAFTTCEPRWPLFAAASAHFLEPDLVSGKASVLLNPFLVIATEHDALFTNATVNAQPMIEFGGGSVVDEGGGCGGGGKLSPNGPVAVGNASLAVDLADADPTSPVAWLMLRLGAPSLLACGPCEVDLGRGPNLGVSLASGAASLPLPVPPDPILIGASASVQALVPGAPGGCPSRPMLSASNRLRLTIAF